MKFALKIALWVAVIGIILYLAFAKTKKDVVAPTPEMTGGAGGERAQTGENYDSEINTESDQSI